MKLYSYQGQEPQALPERIRLKDGKTLTALEQLDDKKLKLYGFSGPVEVPSYDDETQQLTWTGSEYVVSDLSESEIEAKKREKIRTLTENLDASHFLGIFKTTSFHTRIRKDAVVDLKVNILYCDFISHLNASKKVTNLPLYLNKFFFLISFTEQEVQSLQSLLDRFNFNLIYTIPDAEYLSNNTYNFESDTIISSKGPFASWIWNGEKWAAPVDYPTDGKAYIWNEKTKKWKKVQGK